MERAPNNRNKTLEIALLVLVILGCVFLLTQLSGIFLSVWVVLRAVLAPFLIAIIISYLLNPIVSKLVERGVPRGASVLLIYVIFFALVSALLANFIPIFINQMKEFMEHLPSTIEQFESWMKQFNAGKRGMPEAVQKAFDANLASFEERMTNYISGILASSGTILGQLFNAMVIPFLVFYMLKDLKIMERTVVTIFPVRHRKDLIRLLKEIDEALGNYIRGQLLVMLTVGTLVYVGYLIVGMPYSLMLALIVAITNIMPYVGPFIGAAPAITLALTVSPLMALKVAAVNLIVQQLEGNLISPAIVSKSINLHPMLIIFALLLGGEIGGVLGLLLAIPVFAILKVVMDHVLLHYVRR